MIKPIDFTNYANTYYAEVKDKNGNIKTYDKISANSPMEVARLLKANAIKCKKEESTIYVVSNNWRYGEKVKNNYYK